MDNDTKKHEIVIYQAKDGTTEIRVQFDGDTAWLNQSQMVELFGRDQSVISRHIRNALKEGEINKEGNMQNMHIANSDKPIILYDLDTVVSVGYRVKSPEGVRFRRWATSVLRDYVLRGAAINQKRLEQLGKYLEIVSRSEISEVAGVGELMKQYVDALRLLEQYDEGKLATPHGSDEKWQLTYDEARKFLDELKTSESFGDNFASERSQHFSGIVAGIYQTFDGKELYASVEEKAVNLLYQIVKDHPFVDGNKRSGAALFIYFLAKNSVLRDINSNTLAATTLLVALSKPEEKDQILLLIRNFFEGEVKKK